MSDAKKILIIEDDEFLLRMYTAKLTLEGYRVISAVDGDKGIRSAIKHNPDLILLDLILPKKDGFEVLKELKAKSETKNIPVLVLTNLGQKQDIDRCFALGVTDYLIKAHFIPSEVVVKINRILEKF